MNSIIKILAQVTQQKKVFPFYHAVADEVPLHLKHLYEVRNCALFEQDLKFFIKNYKPISANDFLSKHKSPVFHISFDDGLREFKEQAWPILKKYNIPATLFVNPDFVDNKALFYRFKSSLIIDKLMKSQFVNLNQLSAELNHEFGNLTSLVDWVKKINYAGRDKLDTLAKILDIDFATYLLQQKPYLTLVELKELEAEGVIIGAHSMDHPLFNALDYDMQIKQISDSVNWVNEHFKQNVSTFSFPFTDFGLQKELFDAIYSHQNFKLDLSFGTAGLKNERNKKHIQRIPMEDKLESANQILLGEYLYYLAKVPFFKNTIRR